VGPVRRLTEPKVESSSFCGLLRMEHFGALEATPWLHPKRPAKAGSWTKACCSTMARPLPRTRVARNRRATKSPELLRAGMSRWRFGATTEVTGEGQLPGCLTVPWRGLAGGAWGCTEGAQEALRLAVEQTAVIVLVMRAVGAQSSAGGPEVECRWSRGVPGIFRCKIVRGDRWTDNREIPPWGWPRRAGVRRFSQENVRGDR